MSRKLHILIVEDEPKVAETIKAYLENDGYEATHALFGSVALTAFKEKQIDLIILDLMLPDMSGEDICTTIRKSSDVPIIMLTAKKSEEDRVKGLNLGADDYLVKPFSPRELMARIKAIFRRYGVNTEQNQVVEYGKLMIDYTDFKVFKGKSEVMLTPNEFKILTFLSKNAGRYYSREQLMEGALNASSDTYDRAIDSHIKNLRQKIEDNPKAPKYIITQYGYGYKFDGGK